MTMKTLSLLFASLVVLPSWAGDGGRPTEYVNPYCGTDGHGHVFLGAGVPFGMVQAGPTQHTRGWDWCSGYHYSDSVLIGFAHTHLSGTGVGDLGDVLLLPIGGPEQREIRFRHSDETVAPGYYGVDIAEPAVHVDITATARTAIHRYRFATQRALLALDLGQGIGYDATTDWLITQESDRRITGYRRSSGWAKDQRVYFVVDFSEPVTVESKDGDGRAVLSFGEARELTVKVALSPVDIDKAKNNMLAEQPAWDFDGVREAARTAWDDAIGRIDITTGSDDVRRTFHTAMYHLMTAPAVFCDVDGAYRGADGTVGCDTLLNYTILSLWDTYRAAHPLLTVVAPEMQRHFVNTFLNIFRRQGRLPIWHLWGNETECMVGSPGVIVLADLLLKGYVEDEEAAFEALVASMLRDERSLGLLREYGYIPWDKEPENETVAKALEYCIADDAVARVAERLGRTTERQYFGERSRSYARYFDTERLFMRAVGSDGTFREPFDPVMVRHRADDYTEGNAWQYTWLVPHDVHGLINLFGGEAVFCERLDSLFVVEGDLGDAASPDITGLIGQYAHGNEPGHHIAYLYNYAGRPYKTAERVRRIMREMYSPDADGLCGNEDVGQMSAWYVLSAIGLYQVEPCGGPFVIGSPIVDSATIRLPEGRSFTIIADNNGDDSIYVQSATLNGEALSRSYITFEEIMQGGTLRLVMGAKPSQWATDSSATP